MVTAPLLTVGVDVEFKGTLPQRAVQLPKTEAGAVEPVEGSIERHARKAKSSCNLADELVPKLTVRRAAGAKFAADKGTPYGDVAKVLGADRTSWLPGDHRHRPDGRTLRDASTRA